jgi:hypothetical protein
MPIINLLRSSINQIPEEYLDKTERVFSYELYHIFKSRLANNDQLTNNIVLDAELPKRRLSDAEANNLGLIDLGVLMSPDIIVHERDTANHQLLVAEIKVKQSLTRKNFIKDIKKLISLKANYHFQNAVFILVNANMDKVRNYLNHADTIILYNQNIEENEEETISIPNDIDINIITKTGNLLEERTLRELLAENEINQM